MLSQLLLQKPAASSSAGAGADSDSDAAADVRRGRGGAKAAGAGAKGKGKAGAVPAIGSLKKRLGAAAAASDDEGSSAGPAAAGARASSGAAGAGGLDAAADGKGKGKGKKGKKGRSEELVEDVGAYESESDGGADSGDDAFIDKEDDDEDLLAEYEDMKQDFSGDARAAGLAAAAARGKKSKKKAKPSSAAAAAAARRDEDSDDDGGGAKKGSGAKDKAAAGAAGGKGSKRPRPLSDDEKRSLVRTVLDSMAKAAADDRAARKAGQPALAKLRLLPSIKAAASNGQLHALLLEGLSVGAEAMAGGADSNPTILSALRGWLRPLPGSDIPPLQLREGVYDVILDRLPLRLDDLRTSRIGEVLYALAQHPGEEARNRERLLAFIERISRSIFAKRESYRGNVADMLASQARLGLVAAPGASKAPAFGPAGEPPAAVRAAAAAAAAAAAGGSSAGAAMAADGDEDAEVAAPLSRLLGDDGAGAGPSSSSGAGAAAAAVDRSRHAKVPSALIFDFVARPDAVSATSASGIGAAGTGGASAGGAPRKSDLSKKLAEKRRSIKKGIERGAKISVEGRGL